MRLQDVIVVGVVFCCGFVGSVQAQFVRECATGFADRPAFPVHLEQADIDSKSVSMKEVIHAGMNLFAAKFNKCDGLGRPGATGNPFPTPRPLGQPSMTRVSGPDSNACLSCHADPVVGGAGGFVNNAFVLAETHDPIIYSISSEFSNERNPPSLKGVGVVELLAKEMSAELQLQAQALGDGTHTLSSKGVSFEITKVAGEVVSAQGVDTDLVIKPFQQSGTVRTLREFAVGGFNQHFGIQAEEQFDQNPATGFNADFDQDGVERELTVGDITSVVMFLATQGIPQQKAPTDMAQREQLERGEQVFGQIGCTDCHVSQMTLNDATFVDEGSWALKNGSRIKRFETSVNLLQEGQWPRPMRTTGNSASVKVYTDFKRHNLCDDLSHPDPIRVFCNENLDQNRPDQNGKPGREYFLTKRLWDVGSTSPYGHRGDLSTLTEAIEAHAGEARTQRDNFVALSDADRLAVIDFLNSLQIARKTRPIGPMAKTN